MSSRWLLLHECMCSETGCRETVLSFALTNVKLCWPVLTCGFNPTVDQTAFCPSIHAKRVKQITNLMLALSTPTRCFCCVEESENLCERLCLSTGRLGKATVDTSSASFRASLNTRGPKPTFTALHWLHLLHLLYPILTLNSDIDRIFGPNWTQLQNVHWSG